MQQSLLLVAGHWQWRAALATTADAALRASMIERLQALDGAADALFLVILGAFVIGNVALAVACWAPDRLARTVAIGFALAAGLGVISGLTTFGGGVLPAPVMAVLYPLLQPPGPVPDRRLALARGRAPRHEPVPVPPAHYGVRRGAARVPGRT